MAGTARLGYVVKQLETLIRSHLDTLCREHGLTTMQYVALSVLGVHPGMSSAELAARSFVSAQSANQMVATLEGRGLIARSPDRANRRILRIRLTGAGERTLGSCDAAVRDFEARMLAGVSEADEARLHVLLGACIANLRPPRRHAGSPTPICAESAAMEH